MCCSFPCQKMLVSNIVLLSQLLVAFFKTKIKAFNINKSKRQHGTVLLVVVTCNNIFVNKSEFHYKILCACVYFIIKYQ